MDAQEGHFDLSQRESALRIAFSLLRKWRCQMNRDDVEGMVGIAMVRAAQQFDPSKGSKFESFMFYYIKAELIKAIDSAVSAKKAIEVLRDAPPEFATEEPKSNKKAQDLLLPDPDRIAADTPLTPEGRLIAEERSDLVHQALQRIDAKHREVLELVYFKQVHPNELKKQLGLTKSGIRRALRLAQRAMETELKKNGIALYLD